MIWGFAFVGQKTGAEFVGPLTFNAIRFAMGTLVLVVVIFAVNLVRKVPRAKDAKLWRKALLPGMLAGLILATAGGMQQAAMATTSAGKAAFLTGFYMVLVPIVGLFWGRKPSWKIALGVVLGFAGLYFLCIKGDFSIEPGDALLLATSIFWTAHILIIDHFVPKLSALRFSAVQFATTAVLSAFAAFVLDPHPFTGMEHAWGALAYTGFVSVGIAYTLQVLGQRYALPSHAALILSMESLFGAIGGALFLAENLGARGYLGAALLVAGVVVSQLGEASDESVSVESLA
jgi:drug/metabolite transporter (DMT)-like permease